MRLTFLVVSPPPDARFQLSQAVKSARDTLTDSEKISGKWNKDDKVRMHLILYPVQWPYSQPPTSLTFIACGTFHTASDEAGGMGG